MAQGSERAGEPLLESRSLGTVGGSEGWLSTARCLFDLLPHASESGEGRASVHIRSLIQGVPSLPLQTSKRGRAVMASQESPSAHFRVVAKGTGVICRRKGGLPAGTFVGMFSGETYTPWRWFEKQVGCPQLGSVMPTQPCVGFSLPLGYRVAVSPRSAGTAIGHLW